MQKIHRVKTHRKITKVNKNDKTINITITEIQIKSQF